MPLQRPNVNTMKTPVKPNYGLREDGTPKGKGWLGELQHISGNPASEISIGVNIGGKETLIPTIVPNLTKTEIDYMMNSPVGPELFKTPMGRQIRDKAAKFAMERMRQGLSPFKD